ncbi:MAG: hypothetical protein DHS20C06_10350 [Hyphobacterium sp.]|nr:MAG: hypothetical protein DHS20C06_10350 [Hyphobacterium sp.]
MRLLCMSISLVAAACAPNISPAETPEISAEFSRLATRLDSIIAQEERTGFAGQVAIALDDEIVFTRAAGFADAEHHVPMRTDTLIFAASVFKYVTAVTVMRAVEDGEISLNVPMNTFLQTDSAELDTITLQDILSHTSGLGSSYAAESETSRDGALTAILATFDERADPGVFRYSNSAYDLVGIMLETVYKAPFENVVENLTGIHEYAVPFAFWSEIDLLDPHVRAQPIRPTPPELLNRNYGTMAAGGGLFSAESLVNWQIAVKREILTPESLQMLFTPRASMRIGDATFGGFLVDHPQLGTVFQARGYEDRGENTLLADVLDCGLTFAVMTTAGPVEGDQRPAYREIIGNQIFDLALEFCADRTEH